MPTSRRISTSAMPQATEEKIAKFIQAHLSDGLVIVAGSGLSAAEGIPGMPALAEHLTQESTQLSGDDALLWSRIQSDLGAGLEAALLRNAPTTTLELWIIEQTCRLLLPHERRIASAVLSGSKTLRFSKLLEKCLKPINGLPIVTPNYDRLIEIACELAGLHVDTAAIGTYAATFDKDRSFLSACKGVVMRQKKHVLEYYPRALVLKPHGSFDWYRSGSTARRCSMDLDGAERVIITPGINKYRAGYASPFDVHRALANDHIDRAAKLLIVGYGFNDDHLQTHLVERIRAGVPTIILTRSVSEATTKVVDSAPSCLVLSKPPSNGGAVVRFKGVEYHRPGKDIWDLGTLTEEFF